MNSIFLILSSALIFVVLILLVRYSWGIFFDTNYRPVEWKEAIKRGLVNKELISLEKNYPDKVRFFNWWFQIERLKRDEVPGDFAELGVYKGESARIIHKMDPSRKFHLFDTFEGFRVEDLQDESGEAADYTSRNFADTSLELARRTIGGNQNLIFYPGHFPESLVTGLEFLVNLDDATKPARKSDDLRLTTNVWQLALVNLDADLYNPTKAALEYFYPLLSPGGVIFIHDYNYKWPGIKKAADEFVTAIPESLVMVPDMEGTVMIVKSLIGRGSGGGQDLSLDG